jgi:hypothetical protein
VIGGNINPDGRPVTDSGRACEAVGIPAEDGEGRAYDIPWCLTHRRWHEDCLSTSKQTALPPAGLVPGASLEILLAALHLLRSQAALFVGYIEAVPPTNDAHGALASYVRGRCEEVMLEVDLHLSMLNPGAAA